MGTSNAFKGSGGKDASDLRDGISDWLTDLPPASASAGIAALGGTDTAGQSSPDGRPRTGIDPQKLKPTLTLLGGRAGGGGRSRSGGRSSGGPDRSVSRTSRRAGRAASAASAYLRGDRQALERLGLNYDELRALNDPVDVGWRIVAAALDAQPDGTIEDSEERLIASSLVQWMLDAPPDQPPTIEEIVRKSIELMIAEVTLAEVGDRIRTEGATATARKQTEADIRAAAEVMASQVQLSTSGASDAQIAAGIEAGVTELRSIYGVS